MVDQQMSEWKLGKDQYPISRTDFFRDDVHGLAKPGEASGGHMGGARAAT